jgi:hypothetical protein
MSLERGPLALVSTIEELLGRTSSGSGLENRKYVHRDPSRHPLSAIVGTNFSPTSGGGSVGIVLSRIQTTGFIPKYRTVSVSFSCLGQWSLM